MSLSLYTTVLRLARVGAVTWGISVALWALLVFWIYPSISTAFPFEEYLEAIPEELQAAIGLASEEDVALVLQDGGFTLAGFLNTEYISWLPLLLGIYAVVYCGGLVSQEVERGTLDLLLSQPLARTAFLLSKFAGFATLILGITVASYVVVVVGSSVIEGDIDLRYAAAVHLVAVLLALAIAGYSTLASCLFMDPRRSLAVAGLVTALGYFANFVGLSVQSVGWLKNLSLFYYFDSLRLLVVGDVNWVGIGVYVGVTAAGLAIAVVVFQRKDVVR